MPFSKFFNFILQTAGGYYNRDRSRQSKYADDRGGERHYSRDRSSRDQPYDESVKREPQEENEEQPAAPVDKPRERKVLRSCL